VEYVQGPDPALLLLNEAEEIQESYNTSGWTAEEIAEVALKRIDHSTPRKFEGDDIPFMEKHILSPVRTFFQGLQAGKMKNIMMVVCATLMLGMMGLMYLVLVTDNTPKRPGIKKE